MLLKSRLPFFSCLSRPGTVTMITALVLMAASFGCSRPEEGKREKASMAMATLPEATLALVAQAEGFFSEEGLDMRAEFSPYGKVALKHLLDGQVDFATVAETPVMFAVLEGRKIAVIATIVTTKSGHVLVARKDRSIATIADLRGKTIATTTGTSAHFYLDALLVTHGVSTEEVKVVDMAANALPAALARGEVDAVSTFAPYTLLAQRQSGQNAVILGDKDVYTYTFNVVARQEYIASHPDQVRRVLRALIRAEQFTKTHRVEAESIVGKISGLEREVVGMMLEDAELAVSLDQMLVLALEDEADWAIKAGLSHAAAVPNYLPFIYLNGLQGLRPSSVRILK